MTTSCDNDLFVQCFIYTQISFINAVYLAGYRYRGLPPSLLCQYPTEMVSNGDAHSLTVVTMYKLPVALTLTPYTRIQYRMYRIDTPRQSQIETVCKQQTRNSQTWLGDVFILSSDGLTTWTSLHEKPSACYANWNKKAVLSQGNRAMPQLFFSV